MERLSKRDPAEIRHDRAPRIARADILVSQLIEIFGDLKRGMNRGIVGLRDRQGVADVIGMPVGQRDVPALDVIRGMDRHRIAREEGVDYDGVLVCRQTEARVPEKRDVCAHDAWILRENGTDVRLDLGIEPRFGEPRGIRDAGNAVDRSLIK